MWSTVSHGRSLATATIVRGHLRLGPRISKRFKRTNAPFTQQTPTAQRLLDTGLWTTTRPSKTTTPKSRSRNKKDKAADKTRVNIVSEELCDDITKYIGPSLNRHVGCDLVDINPGAGLWSQKLHEVLQPRSHILMEPDVDFYRPFLEPLLSKPGTHVLPRSGILWAELNEALKFLEHQKVPEESVDPDLKPKRNDTLLVTANLAYFPKRRFRKFDSISLLVLYQLLTTVRFSSLFQKYGLVRMLLWVNDEDKRTFIPRTMQRRKKSALQAEFSCEWLAEVAGKDPSTLQVTAAQLKKLYSRDNWLDVESTKDALDRMAAQGIKFPNADRVTAFTADVLANEYTSGPRHKDAPRTEASHVVKPYEAELDKLDQELNEGKLAAGSTGYVRRKALLGQLNRAEKEADNYDSLCADLDRLTELYTAEPRDETELAAHEEAYNHKLNGLGKNNLIEYRLIRDNRHIYHQEPPVLLWDRRPWDPLKVNPSEFFPNVECALLDIQPKAMHPLLRDHGPQSSRAGDIFDLIQRSMLSSSLEPVSVALERLWPGAREGILEHCPSLRDPKRGGLPGSGAAEICSRVLNEEQWMEILAGFMKWPFRPTYAELVGRLGDDLESPESGETTSMMGGGSGPFA